MRVVLAERSVLGRLTGPHPRKYSIMVVCARVVGVYVDDCDGRDGVNTFR